VPKQKTHSGAKKRFKRSKGGKLMHHMSNYFHKNVKKSTRMKRQARRGKELSGGQEKVITRMIGK